MRIILATLVLASLAFGADWIISWDANGEKDLGGYRLFIQDGSVREKFVPVMENPMFHYTGGDSICAWVFAYDLAGNESESSEVVCAKVGEIGAPGGLDVVYCDTLVIEKPVIVVQIDTLRLWYPVTVYDTLYVDVPHYIYKTDTVKVQDDDEIFISIQNELTARPGTQKLAWNDFVENVAPDGEKTKIHILGETTVNVQRDNRAFYVIGGFSVLIMILAIYATLKAKK